MHKNVSIGDEGVTSPKPKFINILKFNIVNITFI